MEKREELMKELRSIVGQQNVSKIDICGIDPKQMELIELKQLIELVRSIQKRREKNVITVDHIIVNNIDKLLDGRSNEFNICGVIPSRMDKEELEEAEKLVEIMKLRSKGLKVMEDRYTMRGENIVVTFDYHPVLVEKINAIPTSEFNRPNKEWLVHISQWLKVEELFRVTQPDIEKKYQEWVNENQTNRLRLTNKGCYLTGLDLPVREIHLATSFPDPNARHMVSYQNGSWDGRVALYERGTGFLPYGLLGRALKVLKDKNISYEYVDDRKRPEKKYEFEGNVTLRDYQENTLREALRNGRGILQLATGAGKTKTASMLVSSYGLDTIFFVHTKFLLNQAKEALEEVLGTEVGQVGDGIIDVKPVTVAMVQTTIRALGDEYEPSSDDLEGDSSSYLDETDIDGKENEIISMLDNAGVVIFDECQFVAADTFYKIANYCSAYYKFGLSATPYRSDKKDLMIEAALGPVIDRVNASFLIRQGYLTRPKIHFFNVGHMKGHDDRNYQQVYREEIVENSQRNTYIIESTKRLNKKNRSALILVQQVNHGKILQEMFYQQGMDVEFVYGDDNLEKRDLEVFKLRTKKKLALIATTIADEGLDIPSLDAVILAGGGKSPSKGMQRVGRAIRVFGDEEEYFEIFTSTKTLIEEGNNSLIIVDDIRKGEELKNFFLSENKQRGKVPISIDFLHGQEFKENKADIMSKIETKEIQQLIVHADDITEEDVANIEPLDSLLVSGGLRFDANKIQRLNNNIKQVRIGIEIEPSTAKNKRPREIVNPENVITEIKKSLSEHKTTLVLVDETRFGNAIRDSLKEDDIQIQFLTGNSQSKRIINRIDDLVNKEQHLLIVNSQYIKQSFNHHLIDKVIIVNGSKPAHQSIEKVEKDIRIFTKKEESFVIDFIDNVRYCYNHSLERRMMFETEEEFVISGWKR